MKNSIGSVRYDSYATNASSALYFVPVAVQECIPLSILLLRTLVNWKHKRDEFPQLLAHLS